MKKCLLLAALLAVQGCASYSNKKEAFHQQFNVGNFEAASTVMYAAVPASKGEEKGENLQSEGKKLPSDFLVLGDLKLFISLNSGTAAMFSQDYQLSDTMFGIAEKAIVEGETDGYRPKYYEKVMLNTYRATALLQAGDKQNAKVEFNRAASSQSAAVQENRKEISKLKEAEDKKYQENIAAANEILKNEYKEFENFKPYADFANPYTSYMSGLFLALNGSRADIENALLDLKRAKSMSPQNKFIQADIQMAQKLANRKAIAPTIWVVYENGLIAEVEKQHFAIPFKLGAGIKLAHLALPKMVPLAAAYPNIQVKGNQKVVATQSIVDMDRVMKTEFKNRYPYEVTKAVVWMTVNLLAQEAAQRSMGENNQLWGTAAALAIGSVSNPVEVRTWSALPKDIQIARLPMPKDRVIQLMDSSGKPLTSEITIDKNINQALVYVRIPTLEAKPAVSVTNLK